jgi:hypothetical protein
MVTMRIQFGVLTVILSSTLVAGCYTLNPNEYVAPDGAASNDAPTTQGGDVAPPDVPMGGSGGGGTSGGTGGGGSSSGLGGSGGEAGVPDASAAQPDVSADGRGGGGGGEAGVPDAPAAQPDVSAGGMGGGAGEIGGAGGSGGDDGVLAGDALPTACGDIGQPCCGTGANRTCTAPGAGCIGPLGCSACGNPGEPCCPNNSCNSGGCCTSGTCTGTGFACPDNIGICQAGACVGDGGSCGGSGDPCCLGGGVGGLICTGSHLACLPRAFGDASGGGRACEPCGGSMQRCCSGGTCDTGLTCNYGGTGICG